MPISVSCDACGRAYRVKDAAAGKTIRCKDCESPIKVPSADSEEIEDYEEDEWGDAASGSDEFGGLPPVTGRSSQSGLPPSPQKKKKKRRSSGSSTNAGPLAKKIGGGLLAVLAFLGIAARVMRTLNRAGALDLGSGGYERQESSPAGTPRGEVRQMLAKGNSERQVSSPTGRPRREVGQNRTKGAFQWQKYSLPGTPLTILMPGKPNVASRTKDGVSTKTATVEFKNPKAAFGFTYADIPTAPKSQLDVERGLAGAKQGMLQRLPPGSKITKERSVSLTDAGGNVHRGTEFTIRSQIKGDQVEFVYRIYFVSRQMAMMFTVVPANEANARRGDTTKYLDSLAVTASIPSAD